MKRRAAEQPVDRTGDELGLGPRVGRREDPDALRGSRLLRGERPPGDEAGRRDRLDRGAHDGPARPVVAAELYGRRARKVGSEAQEESDVGAAEGVDGLVRIADG